MFQNIAHILGQKMLMLLLDHCFFKYLIDIGGGGAIVYQ